MNRNLTLDQQRAVARMQAALVNIERLRVAINRTRRDYGIECRVLTLPLIGFLAHDLEGVLFEHSCALHQRIEIEGGRVAA